jgi:hypothetical protein
MQTQTFKPKNPLASYMRQPKIYIKLPSGGNFWPDRSIDMPETMELPVFSMTAKDELAFKTPDALLNGQAVVDVIQSCIPNIKNAWHAPSLDIETLLIAIRLATYGEKMSFSHKIPVIDEEVDYEIDLRIILDQQRQTTWVEQLAISENLLIFVKPLTLKHMNETSLKSFETTRIMNLVNDDTIPDDKKLEMFNTSFNNLTQITVDLLSESIYKIVADDSEVTDKKQILEFVSNIDKSLFDTINQHLFKLKEMNEIKPIEFTTTEEQQLAGAPATYKIPLNFNESNFFG